MRSECQIMTRVSKDLVKYLEQLDCGLIVLENFLYENDLDISFKNLMTKRINLSEKSYQKVQEIKNVYGFSTVKIINSALYLLDIKN